MLFKSLTDKVSGAVTCPPTVNSAGEFLGEDVCCAKGRTKDTTTRRIRGRKGTAHLILLQHDLSRLDDRGHGVADLEAQLFRAPPGNDALDQVVPYFDDDVGHDSAELEFGDLAFKFVSRGKFHSENHRRE